MKRFALVVLLFPAMALSQIVIEAPAPTLSEDAALGRCIAAINLIGKRPADASLPKVKARTGDQSYLFRWKTDSGFMNCQIDTDKKGKMKVFASAQ